MNLRITAALIGLATCFNLSADISRENFIRNFIQPFQVAACQKTGVISKCFKVNDQQCIKQTNIAFSFCQQEIGERMPKIITSVHESRIWGSNLALCVVQQFKSSQTQLFMDKLARCEGIK